MEIFLIGIHTGNLCGHGMIQTNIKDGYIHLMVLFLGKRLKTTIEENVQKAKEEYQKEFGNP